MAARVIFADGSKAMAHNNEDLFERWMLRHGGNDPASYAYQDLKTYVPVQKHNVDPEHVFIPEFTLPTDVYQCKEMLAVISSRTGFLGNYRKALKEKYVAGDVALADYVRVKEGISIALRELNQQMHDLFEWSKDHPVTTDDEASKRLREVEMMMLDLPLDARVQCVTEFRSIVKRVLGVSFDGMTHEEASVAS